MSDELKRTPLVEEHIRQGGKMVDFAGWYMPVQYSGLMEEHFAVRTKAGLFDVSHMGEIRVTGKDAIPFVNSITSNDVTTLVDNQAHYSLLPTVQGTIIDDLLVYRFASDNLLLVVNASNQDKDFAWIREKAAGFEVTVVNEGPTTGQIAIQGPLASAILQRLTETDLSQIAYYWFRSGEVAGVPALISRTGYTGEDGFEVYMPADQAAKLWNAMLEAGKEEGLIPCGLGARDTLRLEARMHLHGNDMDESTTALEAGLAWVCKFKKACDFVGKSALLAQKAAGIPRKLVGFELDDKGIARHGYPVMQGEREIGVVTSGTHSPTLKKSIGLAYVPSDQAEPGSVIQIKIRNKTAAATIVKGPFYKRTSFPIQ